MTHAYAVAYSGSKLYATALFIAVLDSSEQLLQSIELRRVLLVRTRAALRAVTCFCRRRVQSIAASYTFSLMKSCFEYENFADCE